MFLDNGLQLTYCTNIHPGEGWGEVLQNLKTYLPPLKKEFSPNNPFGIGLRLSRQAAEQLLEQEGQLDALKQWLQDQGLYVFTINGFPYGDFHGQPVKSQIYSPDWTTPKRLDYTLQLARILAELLPEGMDGSISTSPLSYKPWLSGEDDQKVKSTYNQSTQNLAKLVAELLKLKQQTGKIIHVDLEPEPGGLLENSKDVINYYQEWLLPIGMKYLQEQENLTKEEARDAIYNHLQLCFDVGSFSMAYEKPAEAIAKIRHVGIKIGKVQLSTALKATLPHDVETRGEIAETMASFAEPLYLHQVVEKDKDGTLTQYPDLTFALQHIRKPNATEWRTHFRLPIFMKEYNGLASTQEDLMEVLRLLQKSPVTQHLEVESYTWDVLPKDLKKDLSDSIRHELDWTLQRIQEIQSTESTRSAPSRTQNTTD